MAKAVAVADRQNKTGRAPTGPWERAIGFLKDVRNEMRKVTVPSRKEVQSTTGVVIITVFIFAAYFYIVDMIIGTGLDAAADGSWRRIRNGAQKRARAQQVTDEAANSNRHRQQLSAQLEPPRNEKFKWYIIHAYSGFERKVKESIESRVAAFGLENRIGRVMIPTEPVTELRNGKKYTIERVFLPGYVLVEMDLDNDLWHIVKDTPRVTGFLGTGDKPVALSEAGSQLDHVPQRSVEGQAEDEDEV